MIYLQISAFSSGLDLNVECQTRGFGCFCAPDHHASRQDRVLPTHGASAAEHFWPLRGTPQRRLQSPRLGQALAQCDAVLSYGGMGMTSAILMAGKPSVYVTRDLENHINASLVDKLGAGLHLNRRLGARLPALLAKVMEQPAFKKAAEQFAAKHQGHDPAQISARILDGLGDLVAEHAPKKRVRKKSTLAQETAS